MINQKYTSKSTSINCNNLPRLFTAASELKLFIPDSINLDIGGGKFDNVHDFLINKYNTTNLVYDPYNRSKEHNKYVMQAVKKGITSITISNVLNVIYEDERKRHTLSLAKNLLSQGGICMITVYEGDRSSMGRKTGADQWQENKKTKEYTNLVSEYFKDVHIKKGIIIAKYSG
jgi:hypothetical protein